MKLSGIKFNKSIVFEDSIPGLKSSLAAKLPTIYVPSNIPAVIEKDMNLDCYVDSLGMKVVRLMLLRDLNLIIIMSIALIWKNI